MKESIWLEPGLRCRANNHTQKNDPLALFAPLANFRIKTDANPFALGDIQCLEKSLPSYIRVRSLLNRLLSEVAPIEGQGKPSFP